MRILLAQDHPGNGTKVQLLLDLAGHEVVRAASGAEAFARFESQPFPVVVADLCGPLMDGYELCRQIRARIRTEYVYFVLLVAEGSEFHFRQAEAADVDDVLTLPVRPDILRARMRVAERMLRLYQELDQLRGLIPICALCKNVRQEQGLWQQLEAYVGEHSTALFTHTICPECALREFGRLPRNS